MFSSIHYNTQWLFWEEENNPLELSDYPTYQISNINDLENLKFIISNKDNNNQEIVKNGKIKNYNWKINGNTVKSGSTEDFNFYIPTQEDINELISCEITAVSNYDPSYTITKTAYIKIIYVEN